MKKELEEKLVQKYPDILQEYHLTPFESCMGRGFECGDGWYNLIDECCSQLKEYAKEENIKIVFKQVKEKLARLTIYAGTEGGNKEHDKMVFQITSAFAQESKYVCEQCGIKFEEAITKNINGWLSAECDNCRKGDE